MRISDWSSDVCSSDLPSPDPARTTVTAPAGLERLHAALYASLDCALASMAGKGRRPKHTVRTRPLVREFLAGVSGCSRGRWSSEERRVGKASVSKGECWLARNHETKIKSKINK